MGTTCDGEVIVNHVNVGGRTGMQVICSAKNKKNSDIPQAYFRENSWMVDELIVENMSPNGTQVTIVIWAS